MATRPHLGELQNRADTLAALSAEASERREQQRGQYRNGSWRENKGFSRKHGVRIVMRREPGITKGDVLVVPMRFQTPTLNQLARDYQYAWATYDTIRVGQKTRPDGRQLLQLDVDTLLMTADTADASTGTVIWHHSLRPQRILDELRWIMGYTPGSQAEIFRLVLSDPQVWGNQPIVNMLAALEGLQATQQPGEGGAEYVTLSFTEFPEDEDIQRKQRPVSHGANGYTLRAGDTLYEIAKKSHFHRPSAWKAIADANGMTGVSPSSAEDLLQWAKQHHKTTIAIPAAGRS